jgi:DUF4097 and DUF4098 domain-containing protein YvlB
LTFAYGSNDYEVRVPKGVDVRVRTGSGDVEVRTIEAVSLDVETGAGDIEVDGDDYDHTYGSPSETGPRYSVQTGSGDVDVSTDD